jgi:5'-3' exonuclease
VFIAWEGGGSTRRRKIYPEYKLGRRPERLNRFYGSDIPESDENRQHQLLTLIGMLQQLPVCQLYTSDCEGDDVIAFLCRSIFSDKEKVIVSADKDMYQLLDMNTKIYSPHRKRFITSDDVFDEHRVRANNFALIKSICGDVSDNIPGVKGIGIKTATTKFPMLGNDSDVLLQDVIDFAASHIEESVTYKRIFESSDTVKRNYQLIHLDGSMLSHEQMKKIRHVIEIFKPRINKMSLIKTLMKEGINDFDVDSLVYDLHCIDGIEFVTEKR